MSDFIEPAREPQAIRKLEPGKLVIASHNEGKVREIGELLEGRGLDVVSAASLDLPSPPETGASFLANAEIKARVAADLSGLPALADDSGLVVEALGGMPGIFTADWAERQGFEGAPGRDWYMAMGKVEGMLQAIGPDASRAAHFTCVLCLAWPDGHSEAFEGRVNGSLAWPPRGEMGFGYDPVFVPKGGERSFAELEPQEKARISHRADAFAKMIAAVF